jgi:hypothetical protein
MSPGVESETLEREVTHTHFNSRGRPVGDPAGEVRGTERAIDPAQPPAACRHGGDLVPRWGAIVLASLRPSHAQAEPSQSKAIEADRLTLRDGNGKTRAELVMGAQGPGLAFYDAAGKPRAGLGLRNGGTTLRVLSDNGRAPSGFSVERGGVAMAYVDKNGRVHEGNEALKTDTGFALSDEPPATPTPRPAGRP